MPRSPSSLLFGLVLCLSFALVVWWTLFQLAASRELADAAERLLAGDVEQAARALGADSTAQLAEIAHRRHAMFASEGAFFAVVLVGIGWLYFASVRRETALRTTQDRFLAAATHELKTPLTTIVLLLESLRDGRVPEEKRQRYLTNGLLEAERLDRGLHNVLTAAGLRSAGPRSGGKGMREEPGDLAADVREAVEALRARALAAEVTLSVDAPASLPMRRDAAAVQLVLRNLLDNAIKYSPAGATVAITLQVDGGEARVTVQDAGRGLDAHELAHAFEPFFRGSDVATGGAGLGLHLVHQLVTAHGGTVRADSDGRHRGALFTIRLPLGRAA